MFTHPLAFYQDDWGLKWYAVILLSIGLTELISLFISGGERNALEVLGKHSYGILVLHGWIFAAAYDDFFIRSNYCWIILILTCTAAGMQYDWLVYRFINKIRLKDQ